MSWIEDELKSTGKKIDSSDENNDWSNVKSRAEEKEDTQHYSIVDSSEIGQYVVSDKRRYGIETKDIFVKMDVELVKVIEEQKATKAAVINSLIRYAINDLKKNNKKLVVVQKNQRSAK